MNTAVTKNDVKQALEVSGNAWLLGYWGSDAEFYLEQTARQIMEFLAEYERRFGERPDPFRLLSEAPAKGRAFFQTDTLLTSLDMKIMIWRILLGCEIQQVEFLYRLGQQTKLVITLQTPYGAEEQYLGQPQDFRVLRHFGATGADGRLILQGYYALK